MMNSTKESTDQYLSPSLSLSLSLRLYIPLNFLIQEICGYMGCVVLSNIGFLFIGLMLLFSPLVP